MAWGHGIAKPANNEGSIYRRRDGRWAASLTVGYEGGKRSPRTHYGRPQRQLKEQLVAARRAVEPDWAGSTRASAIWFYELKEKRGAPGGIRTPDTWSEVVTGCRYLDHVVRSRKYRPNTPLFHLRERSKSMQFPGSVRARVIGLMALTTAFLAGLGGQAVQAHQPGFTQKFFELEPGRCQWDSTGDNLYFPLVPGNQQVLEDKEDKKNNVRLTITTKNETQRISLSSNNGGVTIYARVVEERETVNGKLFEVSRNFFAICRQTGTVFYFGEDVEFYNEAGQVISTDGTWRAGVNGAKAGLQMLSGTPPNGARYFQEVAPGVAEDRAEVVSTTGKVQNPLLESFSNLLITQESSALESGTSFKYYLQGVGLIQDGTSLQLVSCRGGPPPCTR